jgi:hypothetical protein
LTIIAILLLAAGLELLLRVERPLALAGLRRDSKRLRLAALAYGRSAPVSSIYLIVLLVTTLVLQTSTAGTANSLLGELSTNLHHLAQDPVRVLVTSAFWVSSAWQIFFVAPMLLLVVAPLERRIGGSKTIAVLVLGHVGATLVTAVGLWVGVRTGVVDPSVADAQDVGPSYALFAAAACLGFVLERRLRLSYFAALIGYAVWNVFASTTFTDFGHLLSIGFGLACYPLVRSAHPQLPPVGNRLAELAPGRPRAGRSLLS